MTAGLQWDSEIAKGNVKEKVCQVGADGPPDLKSQVN